MSDHVNQCTFEFICTHNTIECFDVPVNERMPASNICTHDEAVTCAPTYIHMHKGGRRQEDSAVILLSWLTTA